MTRPLFSLGDANLGVTVHGQWWEHGGPLAAVSDRLGRSRRAHIARRNSHGDGGGLAAHVPAVALAAGTVLGLVLLTAACLVLLPLPFAVAVLVTAAVSTAGSWAAAHLRRGTYQVVAQAHGAIAGREVVGRSEAVMVANLAFDSLAAGADPAQALGLPTARY